jgi:hypothetical protein
MLYFNSCENIEELKAEYRRLVKIHHPDAGGDEKTMKIVNNEFHNAIDNVLCASFSVWKENNSDREFSFDKEVFGDILRKIVEWNITIEIIGYWIYVFNSFEYRNELKEFGFWFSKKHKAWVYSGGKKIRIRTSFTTNDIRNMHGSQIVRSTKEKENEKKPQKTVDKLV